MSLLTVTTHQIPFQKKKIQTYLQNLILIRNPNQTKNIYTCELTKQFYDKFQYLKNNCYPILDA